MTKLISCGIARAGALLFAVVISANAALVDRGGGLIYDTVLNVTWLQDANYAMTSGYSADGRMSWSEANAWAANLRYFDSVRGVTYDDWHLPDTGPSNAAGFNYNFSPAGDTDVGYNILSPASQMSYMHYVNLGNLGLHTVSGAESGCYVSSTDTCLDHTGPFVNLQAGYYWSSTEYAPVTSGAWVFNFGNGGQGAVDKSNLLSAWAVRSGDVGAAPVRVTIDIKPYQEKDTIRINLQKNRFLRVAILTTGDFDAMQVDPATVRFGPAQVAITRYHVGDVNGDGSADMVLIFKTADTGIAECDTRATLTASLYDGTVIAGSDTFVTRKCPKCAPR